MLTLHRALPELMRCVLAHGSPAASTSPDRRGDDSVMLRAVGQREC